MKLTNIGYVAKLNKQKTKKGRDRLWRSGARGNGKSSIDLERNMRKIGVEITPKEAGQDIATERGLLANALEVLIFG